MHLLETLSNRWNHVQEFLFPFMRREVGPLTPTHERLVVVLDIVSVERFVPSVQGVPGRPPEDRQAIARAFIAKAVANLPTTSALVDRLKTDVAMRRLCGWESASSVPSESTFSRAFGEFARIGLSSAMHEALVVATHQDRTVGHISRDSTAIVAREKPEKTEKPAPVPKRKRGRPKKVGAKKICQKKGAEPVPPVPNEEEDVLPPLLEPKEEKRLDMQLRMSLDEMLKNLPTHCGIGAKRDAKGHLTTWDGYKLHVDTADGDIPVAALLTSASLHDSQVAIPLAATTAQRLQNYYALMDAAYDAPQIFTYIRSLGQVPIIARNPRRGGKEEARREALARGKTGIPDAESVRFRQRSSAERVNSNLKDNYGGRHVRVRGHAKVLCHLMFGLLALTVEQLMRLVA